MIEIEEIKNRISIEDILAEQGISLKRGRCRCPLHGGNNPTSFSVSRDRQTFHCFACGKSGDVITLVQKLHGIDFKEAVTYLASKAGLTEDSYPGSNAERKKIRVKQTKASSGKEDEDEILDLLIKLWEKVLKRLNEDLKTRRISLSQYYADQQYAEYQLSRLDEMSIYENYHQKRKKRDG